MKHKFRGVNFNVYSIIDAYDYWTIIPTIQVCQKFWYLWYIDLCFLKWALRIEICRKDWNYYNN